MSSSLVLPPDLTAKLNARIESGAASDEIDALRSAFEALEQADAAKLEAVRAKIGRALDDPRPSVAADVAFDRVEVVMAALARA
jgi:Arc/MetJ-type ribon-helix-helix transcriptional regulator